MLALLILVLSKTMVKLNMKIIAVVESDDYGPAAILDPTHITITRFNGFYLAASRCVFRNTPITCEISEETALSLIKKCVQCLNMSGNNNTLEIEKE